jgi:hypothetical protein
MKGFKFSTHQNFFSDSNKKRIDNLILKYGPEFKREFSQQFKDLGSDGRCFKYHWVLSAIASNFTRQEFFENEKGNMFRIFLYILECDLDRQEKLYYDHGGKL